MTIEERDGILSSKGFSSKGFSNKGLSNKGLDSKGLSNKGLDSIVYVNGKGERGFCHAAQGKAMNSSPY